MASRTDARGSAERLRPRHGRGAMTRLKETTMYRKIVVGYDDTEQAKDALALGRQLADATGAALIAAGVVAIGSMWAAGDADRGDADAQFARKLDEAAAAAG